MSLRQLGNRLNISAQSVRELEQRESNDSITIKKLREAGAALDMRFVYGYIPIKHSVEEMIEKRAFEIAKEIVLRTSNSMSLEDQGNSSTRINNAIKSRAKEIRINMPQYLWD